MRTVEEYKETLSQTLVSRCYSQLRERIITGEFAPGEKLKVANLASLLGSGPTPVREALSRLASTGLITAVDNKGFRVRDVSEAEAKDLYSAFREIEKIVLRLSIEKGTAVWEGEVVASMHRLSIIENGRTAKFADWFGANEAFHATLVSACGSPVLLSIREELVQRLGRYTFLSFEANALRLKQNHREHEMLAKAAIGRNADLACRLMDAHLSGSGEEVVKWIKKNNAKCSKG